MYEANNGAKYNKANAMTLMEIVRHYRPGLDADTIEYVIRRLSCLASCLNRVQLASRLDHLPEGANERTTVDNWVRAFYNGKNGIPKRKTRRS